MKLTKNFDSSEFVVSREFPELAANIIPTEADIEKMKFICVHWLQPLRDTFGPVQITSGIRSPELNVAVRGSVRSDHLYHWKDSMACAVDFTLEGASKLRFIVEYFRYLGGFKQLIWYKQRGFFHFAPLGLSDTWKQVIFR